MSANASLRALLLGRDRCHNRYWVFQFLPGIFVELITLEEEPVPEEVTEMMLHYQNVIEPMDTNSKSSCPHNVIPEMSTEGKIHLAFLINLTFS